MSDSLYEVGIYDASRQLTIIRGKSPREAWKSADRIVRSYARADGLTTEHGYSATRTERGTRARFERGVFRALDLRTW